MMRSFLPPYIVARLAQEKSAFTGTLHDDEGFRAVRAAGIFRPRPGGIEVYDVASYTRLPGRRAAENLEQTQRIRKWAQDATDVLGVTEFPDAVVRYGQGYTNAFYDGRFLVFGQGDGELFGDFTTALDVFAHEYGHRLVDAGPGLVYKGQSGALNEHIADVLGISVAQYRQQAQDDWRVGEELFLREGMALRDMMNPGTAYDAPDLGADPQPDHMRAYVHTVEDHGGVHINSGIPNRAFALFTTALAVPSWGVPLTIWRSALEHVHAHTDFAGFARAVVASAGECADVARDAWAAVGIPVN